MLEELQVRNLSQNTINQYLGTVKRFALHFKKSPEQLGPDHIRQYLLHLRNEKNSARNTIQAYRGALRFLYLRVLKQSWFDEEIAVPRERLQLPTVLTPDEITRILEHTINLDDHCDLLVPAEVPTGRYPRGRYLWLPARAGSSAGYRLRV